MSEPAHHDTIHPTTAPDRGPRFVLDEPSRSRLDHLSWNTDTGSHERIDVCSNFTEAADQVRSPIRRPQAGG
jgi:hypothetical protein